MTIPRMNQLVKSWAKRRAREVRDMGTAHAAAMAGKLKEIKAPEEEGPQRGDVEGWNNEIWWANDATEPDPA